MSTPATFDIKTAQSVSSFAAEYGQSPATVRRWANSGMLPAFRIGSRIFIPANAINELVQPVSVQSAS